MRAKKKGALSRAFYSRDRDLSLVEYFLCATYHFSTALPGFLSRPFRSNPNLPGNPFRPVPCSTNHVSSAAVSSTCYAAPTVAFHRDRLSTDRRSVGRRQGRTNERDRHQHSGGEKHCDNFLHVNTSLVLSKSS